MFWWYEHSPSACLPLDATRSLTNVFLFQYANNGKAIHMGIERSQAHGIQALVPTVPFQNASFEVYGIVGPAGVPQRRANEERLNTPPQL